MFSTCRIATAPVSATIALLLALAGCAPAPRTGPAATATVEYDVFESFERPGFWSVGGDRAEMTLGPAGATHGNTALRLTSPLAPAGMQLPLAGELPLDLSVATRLQVDVSVREGGPVEIELHARSRRGTYFIFERHRAEGETPQAVTFDLSRPVSSAQGEAGLRAWDSERAEITTVFLCVYSTRRGPIDVSLDALRADAPADRVLRDVPPSIVRVAASADTVERFEAFELTVVVDGRTSNPFDRQGGLAIDGIFYGPSGQRIAIPAFLYSVEADDALPAPDTGIAGGGAIESFRAGDGTWKIRFAPTEPGRWEYEVVARSGIHSAVSERGAFRCEVGRRPGYVRVAPRDRRYFETDGGAFYRPVGQNVAWADDYAYYFEKIAEYGGNWVRIWMCPWNLELEPKRSPGWYDLGVARELDRIVSLAERHGIHIQLVLLWHDEFADSFARSPFNAENGGPLHSPEGLFYLPEGRRHFRRRLDYIVARWGHSPAIMAWELFNEVDLTRYRHADDVAEWHLEMAGYLKRIDPAGRLVTTSFSSGGDRTGLPERLWALSDIDFTQAHLYDPDIHTLARSAAARYARYGKPFFVAEFGRGYHARDDQADPIGATLHAGLWSTAVSTDAGLAKTWWWDTYVDPRDLYGTFRHVAAFGKDMPLAGQNRRDIEITLTPPHGPEVRVVGSAGRTDADLWAYAPQHVRLPRENGAPPVLTDPAPIRLRGLLDGRYRIRPYNPHTGHWGDEREARAEGGTLRFDIPATEKDIALRIRAVEPVEVRLEVDDWGR